MGMGAFVYVNGEAYDFFECQEAIIIVPTDENVMNLNYKVCFRAEKGYGDVTGCVYVADVRGKSVCRVFGYPSEEDGSMGCYSFSITTNDVLVYICLENEHFYPDSTDDFEEERIEAIDKYTNRVIQYVDNKMEDEE